MAEIFVVFLLYLFVSCFSEAQAKNIPIYCGFWCSQSTAASPATAFSPTRIPRINPQPQHQQNISWQWLDPLRQLQATVDLFLVSGTSVIDFAPFPDLDDDDDDHGEVHPRLTR